MFPRTRVYRPGMFVDAALKLLALSAALTALAAANVFLYYAIKGPGLLSLGSMIAFCVMVAAIVIATVARRSLPVESN
jgi:hypothetical protein